MLVRRLLPLLVLPAVLTGCGGGGAHDAVGRAHPTGARDVVLRVSEDAGATSAQLSFGTPPVVVVTGDGTLYLRMEEATRRGIVWPLVTRQVSEEQVQTVLREADDAGLLAAPPDYETATVVQDGGSTTVVLGGGGGPWTHRADALGAAGDESGARGRLQDFVEYVDRWAHDPHGARAREVTPTVLRVMATPMTGRFALEGALATWPAGARVRLADVGACRVVRDPVAVRTLTTRPDAYYRDGPSIYHVAAAVLLPGDSCSD